MKTEQGTKKLLFACSLKLFTSIMLLSIFFFLLSFPELFPQEALIALTVSIAFTSFFFSFLQSFAK